MTIQTLFVQEILPINKQLINYGFVALPLRSFLFTSSLNKHIVLQNVLQQNDKLYSAKYSGWYSVPDETFLSEDQLKEKVEPDGSKTIISGETGHPVQWVEEMNYMFRLSSFQDDIKYWLNQSGEYTFYRFNAGILYNIESRVVTF